MRVDSVSAPATPSPARRIRVADSAEAHPGRTVAFEFEVAGRLRAGFAACHEGRWVAYENECRHIPLTLDYGDQRFFTADEKFFICQTHSALYDPFTGLCVRGPCEGDRLKPLRVDAEADGLWLQIPEN